MTLACVGATYFVTLKRPVRIFDWYFADLDLDEKCDLTLSRFRIVEIWSIFLLLHFDS